MKPRKPIKRKRSKPRRIQGVRNPELVKWVQTLPCHRCRVLGRKQITRTECAHIPGSRRFGDESNVWPLCAGCHRIARDSFHEGPKTFYATLGIDKDFAQAISDGYMNWFCSQASAA